MPLGRYSEKEGKKNAIQICTASVGVGKEESGNCLDGNQSPRSGEMGGGCSEMVGGGRCQNI